MRYLARCPPLVHSFRKHHPPIARLTFRRHIAVHGNIVRNDIVVRGRHEVPDARVTTNVMLGVEIVQRAEVAALARNLKVGLVPRTALDPDKVHHVGGAVTRQVVEERQDAVVPVGSVVRLKHAIVLAVEELAQHVHAVYLVRRVELGEEHLVAVAPVVWDAHVRRRVLVEAAHLLLCDEKHVFLSVEAVEELVDLRVPGVLPNRSGRAQKRRLCLLDRRGPGFWLFQAPYSIRD